MAGAPAVRVAIDLVQVPSRVRHYRDRPLPGGVETILRIAAGIEGAEAEAAAAVGRPPELVRRAAAFFIEQILLSSDADSYRVLGADDTATAAQLRHNMALLLRWLHPDVDRLGVRSLFAGRVTEAWETLKTPERRAAYDLGRSANGAGGRRAKPRQRVKRYARGAGPHHHAWGEEPEGFLRRAVRRLMRGS